MLVLRSPFSFSVILWNGATSIHGGSSHPSELSLGNPSQVRSEACLLGDSERCQVGAVNHHSNPGCG